MFPDTDDINSKKQPKPGVIKNTRSSYFVLMGVVTSLTCFVIVIVQTLKYILLDMVLNWPEASGDSFSYLES